ncbi:MAG: sulfatase-like hydrolase/transferase [Planctomycetes bacterium]|nr:sulfatase-like hydrolase/transferase [Planctomycetota bacterium]
MNQKQVSPGQGAFGLQAVRVVWAALLATGAVLGLDLYLRGKSLPEDSAPSLLGFAGLVLGVLIVAGWTVLVLHRILGRIFGGRRAFMATAAFFLPALPLIIRTAFLIFDTPRMQKNEYGGLAPACLVIAICIGIMVAASLTGWFARRGWGRPFAFLGLAGFAYVCRRFDTHFYPGLYPHLHQFAVVALYAVAACAAFILVPRSALGKPGIVLGLCVCALGGWSGYRHLESFLGSAPSARRLIGTELQTTSRLWQLVPYRRTVVTEDRQIPAGLSARAQRHLEARDRARKAVAAKVGADKKWNVLIYSIDAVRFDHTTMAGYERLTTPFMAELAKGSVNFTRARSPATASFLSLHSLLTGAEPSTIDALHGKNPPLLSTHLASFGWKTAAWFSDAIFTVRDRSWPEADGTLGFQQVFGDHPYAEETTDDILDFVDANRGGGPFLAFTHIMNPHAPYEPRPEGIWGHQPMDNYDGELAHVDAQLKRLWAGLEQRGVAKDTLLIITSDHGEAFGEKKQFMHGGPPNWVQSAVPLMLYAPGLLEPRTVAAPVSNVSIPATLCDILSLPDLPENEATSLLPLALGIENGDDSYCVVERPALSQFPGMSPSRSIVYKGYELVLDLGLGVGNLYHVDEDPLHAFDVAESEPEVLQELTELEKEWRNDRLLRATPTGDAAALPVAYRSERQLVEAGDVRALETFDRFINDPDELVQRDAVKVLLDLRNTRNPKPIEFQPYTGKDAQVIALCNALAFAQGKSELGELLIAQLGEFPDDVELRIVRALASNATAIGDLGPLKARLAATENPDLRFELACALGNAGDPSVHELLLSYAKDADQDRLRALICAACHIPGKEAWERLVDVANEVGIEAQVFLCWYGYFQETEERHAWVRDLFRQSNGRIRSNGLAASERFKDQPFRVGIFELVLDYEEDQRFRAVAAKNVKNSKSERAPQLLLDLCATDPVLGPRGAGFLRDLGRPVNDCRHLMDLAEVEVPAGPPVEVEIASLQLQEHEESRRAYVIARFGDDAIGGRIVLSAEGLEAMEFPIRAPEETFRFDLPKEVTRFGIQALGGANESVAWKRQGLIGVIPRIEESRWPQGMPDAGDVYAFARLDGHWVMADRPDGKIWLRSPQGTFRFCGADERPKRLMIEGVLPRTANFALELNGKLLHEERLEQGEIKVTAEVGDAPFFPKQRNRLVIRLSEPRGEPLDVSPSPGGALGLKSILWE